MANRIDISPAIKAAISTIDLLRPRGKFQMLSLNKQNIFAECGTYFIVEGDDFHFQLSVDETGLYAERNGQQCILTPEMLNKKQLLFFVLTWSPDKIRLITAELPERHIEIEINTPPCSVPLSLKRWAKDQSLLPKKEYDTESNFRDAVHQCLSDLKYKIEDNVSGESFWDYSYEGNRIKGRTPKRETLIQPLIKTIIDTELYLRGIQVFRENTTPAGDIDFTVVGYVKGAGVVNMCIELKNAHSTHLENGLLNQLPDYMRCQDSQFGAYCVLNYNLQNGDRLIRSELVQKLALLKLKSKDPLVATNIRIFVIDLDEKIIESKRK